LVTGYDLLVRCGIVLAAGSGMRLRPLIHRLRGDHLPKQYVNLIGTRSLLQITHARTRKLIPPERLFTVVSRDHLEHPEVERQLSDLPPGTVVIKQPMNRDTGPGILLPLMYIYKHYPRSIVVVFPSDHFIGEEESFMDHVHVACQAVERQPSRLVLLGIQPSGPETEYGYIQLGQKVNRLSSLGIYEVSRFIEKPEIHHARELIKTGAFWNTMVMVFEVRSTLELVSQVEPTLHRRFGAILEKIGTPGESRAVEEAYRRMASVNFSHGILQQIARSHPSRLAVLPVRDVTWSDLGSERRILDLLRKDTAQARLPAGREMETLLREATIALGRIK